MALGTFTLTGEYQNLAGEPAKGLVTISVVGGGSIVDPSGNVVFSAKKAVRLDEDGSFSVTLPTTGGGTLPASFGYELRLTQASVAPVTVQFAPPAAGAVLDMADVTPTTIVPADASEVFAPLGAGQTIVYAENSSGVAVPFSTVLELNTGCVIEVPPTDSDVWIEWGASCGTSAGGQGVVYTFIYEVDDATATPRGRKSTWFPSGAAASAAAVSHDGKTRVGPSATSRTFGLYGIVVREAGSSLAAYFDNSNSDYGRSWISAVAQ